MDLKGKIVESFWVLLGKVWEEFDALQEGYVVSFFVCFSIFSFCGREVSNHHT